MAAVSLASIAVAAGPAAAKTAKPVGQVLCPVGGSLTFNPPLTPGNGTPGFSNEIVSVNLTLSGCGGISSPSGLAPTAASSVVTKSLKIKATKIGKTKYAGGCNTFVGGFLASSLKSSITWNNGIAPSTTTFVGLSDQQNATEIGFNNHSGMTTKSFAGPASVNAFFDVPSSNAIINCAEHSGGPVPSLTLDSSTSLMGIGTDVAGAQKTFSYNGTNGTDGSPQSWTVPSGINLVRVTAFGAQGAAGDSFIGSGGLGGEASATLLVTPGETLTVVVGGTPFGGGGIGDRKGGGASDVRQGGNDLAHRVVVAGGGGGGGGNDNNAVPQQESGGSGGGVAGGDGAGEGAGSGATSSAGGSSGGSLGNGGMGTGNFLGSGSGGGGGYYGGGGGNGGAFFIGAGGGGSGFIPGGCTATACSTGVQTGNGSVTIAY
jgi:hypothetical protein